MQRWIISLNWTLGSLLFIAAVAVPLLRDWLWLPTNRKAAEMAVDQLKQAEDRYFGEKQRYLLFPSGHIPGELSNQVGTGRYQLGASVSSDGSLVLSARPLGSDIQSGVLPADVFELRLNLAKDQLQRVWTKSPSDG
ncbi:MAG: type IV pilin protein [Magnetococcus sp. DMHC-1]